jgi:preprotein translocase subunit SecG
MFITLVILAIIICILLALIILIQNPKGGGLSSGFAGSNNVMGVQRTGDFLEKGTWVLIISLMLIILVLNAVPQGESAANSTESIQNEVQRPAGAGPMAPAPLPQAPKK